MELGQVAQAGALTLMGTALTLGVGHGIDWDHIAAITDISSTASASTAARSRRAGRLDWRAVGLASLYALGHAGAVAILGGAALYFGALLPDWVDPLMERV